MSEPATDDMVASLKAVLLSAQQDFVTPALIARIEAERAVNADLLAALELMMDGTDTFWETTPEGVASIAAARAAIAKAKGVAS